MTCLIERIEQVNRVGEVVGPLEGVCRKVSPSRVDCLDDDLGVRHARLHDVQHCLKPAVQHGKAPDGAAGATPP